MSAGLYEKPATSRLWFGDTVLRELRELRGLDGTPALIWRYHHKIASDPAFPPDLEEFIDTCRPGIEADRIWFGRTHCGGCFQRLKLENTATCIECH